MAGGGRQSNLWTGYDDYEAPHGTLAANTVKTETFTENVTALLIQHKGNVTDSMWVTVNTPARPSPSNPSSGGTGDTNNEMIEITEGAEINLDLAATAVNMKSSGTVDYQIVGLRV